MVYRNIEVSLSEDALARFTGAQTGADNDVRLVIERAIMERLFGTPGTDPDEVNVHGIEEEG